MDLYMYACTAADAQLKLDVKSPAETIHWVLCMWIYASFFTLTVENELYMKLNVAKWTGQDTEVKGGGASVKTHQVRRAGSVDCRSQSLPNST